MSEPNVDTSNTADKVPPSLSYRVELDDLRAINRTFPFLAQHSSVLILVISAIPGLAAALILKAPFAFFGLLAFGVLMIVRQLVNRPKVIEQVDPENFELLKMSFHPDYLITESESEKFIRLWRNMYSCRIIDAGILLSIRKSYRMLIPRRAFDDQSQMESIGDQISELIEDAKSSSGKHKEIEIPKLMAEPLPASVRFEQKFWELIQAQNKYSSREPQPISFLWSISIVVAMFIGGLLGYFSYFYVFGPISAYSGYREILAAFVFVISFIFVAKLLVFIFLKNVGGPESSERTMVDVNLSVDSLEIRTASSAALYDCQYIRSVELLPKLGVAIVSKVGMAIILIPERAFENREHRDFFIATVDALANQSFQPGRDEIITPEIVETGNPFQPPTNDQI